MTMNDQTAVSNLRTAIDKSQNGEANVGVNLLCNARGIEPLMNKIDPGCKIENLEFGRYRVSGFLAEAYSIRGNINGIATPGM